MSALNYDSIRCDTLLRKQRHQQPDATGTPIGDRSRKPARRWSYVDRFVTRARPAATGLPLNAPKLNRDAVIVCSGGSFPSDLHMQVGDHDVIFALLENVTRGGGVIPETSSKITQCELWNLELGCPSRLQVPWQASGAGRQLFASVPGTSLQSRPSVELVFSQESTRECWRSGSAMPAFSAPSRRDPPAASTIYPKFG